MIKPSRSIAAIIIPVLVAACASTPAVRNLADKTGVFVTSLNAGTAEFIDAQNRLNAENDIRLNDLAASGVLERAGGRQQRLAWRDVGDVNRLENAEGATSVTAEQIVAGLSTSPPVSARISTDVLDGYGKALQALARLSAKPKFSDQLQETVAYGAEVIDQYGKLRKADADKSKSAGDAGNVAAASDQAAGVAATDK